MMLSLSRWFMYRGAVAVTVMSLAAAGVASAQTVVQPSSTTVILAPSAPPPPQTEVIPPPPDAIAQWDPGHWTWDGQQWVWRTGHFQTPPNTVQTSGWHWIPGQWIQQPNGGWAWQAGRWG